MSGMRRGKPTANATWDNATAVLVGDYLIARSFNLCGFCPLPLLQLFQMAPVISLKGKYCSYNISMTPEATEADYMKIIDGKTSRLFMMASQGVAILENRPEYNDAFAKFGQHFGNAFQIIDDILDFVGDSEVLGKTWVMILLRASPPCR